MSESPYSEGSGVEEDGSGILSVSTVTERSEVFFQSTTTGNEAVGEVETLQPTAVDFTYTISTQKSVTESLIDQIEAATAQPDTGSEQSRTFELPPTGQ